MTKIVKCLAGLTLASMLVLPAGAYSAGPAQKAPAEAKAAGSPNAAAPSRAVLELKETAFDFGTIMEGQPADHVFLVANTGPDNLVINSVKPG